MSDLRKIALTSDYAKLLEMFLKDWILEDISENLDPSQYGARKGSGTEHLLVAFTDRILKLLDSVRERSAVIASAVDWANAFDRMDPTITTRKLITTGLRPSLVSILVSYMENRRMIVRFNGAESTEKKLIGGGPQGTILGGLEYIVSNNDCNKEETSSDDRYKYFDDLNLLEFVILTDQLRQYDFKTHVASDIGNDHLFLDPEKIAMQTYLDQISDWTEQNLMLLNERKSSYIVFSRSKEAFSTRLKIKSITLERKNVIRILGVWFQEDLKWNYNVKQICIKAYSRMYILNKLKYAGIPQSDLLTIYKLSIRSIAEYCSALFHTSLTQELSDKLEAIQKTAVKIILADQYSDYISALETLSLDTLFQRREVHLKKFSLKCISDVHNAKLFPENQNVRGKNIYHVNFARTNQYLQSTIPQGQRMLNTLFTQE